MSLNKVSQHKRKTKGDIVLSLYGNQDFPFQHHLPQGRQLERKKKHVND